MIESLKEKYISYLLDKYLHLTNIQEIRDKIEDDGYNIGKLHFLRKIQRFTAKNKDRNQIEFILTKDNLYMIIYLGFSNFYDDNIIVYSRNNILPLFHLLKIDVDLSFRSLKLESETIFLCKNLMRSFNKNKSINKLTLVNKSFRDKILNFEMTNLPLFSEMSLKKKESLVKKVSFDYFQALIYNYHSFYGDRKLFLISLLKNQLLSNYKVRNGNFFYPYLYNKYSFTDDELNLFFINHILPYIEENHKKLILIVQKKDIFNNPSFIDNFYKFIIFDFRFFSFLKTAFCHEEENGSLSNKLINKLVYGELTNELL